MKTKKSPLVSIIIPTRNEERNIEKCLSSIKDQGYQNIEVIVVDQESGDKTLAIAKRFKAQIVSVPYPGFYTPPSKSRNIGAKRSKGEFLYHLDCDMRLSKNLLREAVDKFSLDPKLGALIVHENDLAKGFWGRCKTLERRCCWGNDRLESARIVRRKIFEKIGGYDEKISSGEDFDIHRRYKNHGRIGFCQGTVFHELGQLSFRKQIRKKYSYGKTASVYFNKHHESGFSVIKEEVGSYLKHYPRFLKDPITGTGVLILKVCEFCAGLGGFLAAKRSKLKF